MLHTPTISEFDTGLPATYAFRIGGKVTGEDMQAMAERVDAIFDRRGKADLLLSFVEFEGTEFGASLSWDNVKVRFRSISQVRNYVTAGAPDAAQGMIRFFGALLPVETRNFENEDEALAWLHAEPRLSAAA